MLQLAYKRLTVEVRVHSDDPLEMYQRPSVDSLLDPLDQRTEAGWAQKSSTQALYVTDTRRTIVGVTFSDRRWSQMSFLLQDV